MSDRFGALEGRTAEAVFRHLANARIEQVGAVATSLPCVFDNAAVTALQMEALSPQALVLSHQVAAVQHQTALLIRRTGAAEAQAFAVAGIEPDGTGLTRLLLEVAP